MSLHVMPPVSRLQLGDSRQLFLCVNHCLFVRAFSLHLRTKVVLSCTQDDFFARNRFSNFGDLGVAVKNLMDDYQRATRLNENINSIEDMQAFLERCVSLLLLSTSICSRYRVAMSEGD